jgi:hypothetical protein
MDRQRIFFGWVALMILVSGPFLEKNVKLNGVFPTQICVFRKADAEVFAGFFHVVELGVV